MGAVNNAWVEYQETGICPLTDSEQWICQRCLSSGFYDLLVESYNFESSNVKCSFCDSIKSCLNQEETLKHINTCVTYYYNDPVHGVPYDGGYLLPLVEVSDITTNIFSSLPVNSKFLDRVEEMLDVHGWVEVGENGDWKSCREADNYLFSWQRFCKHVKHRNRYFFLEPFARSAEFLRDGSTTIYNPLEFLSNLMKDIGLVKEIEPDTMLYRATYIKEHELTSRPEKDFYPPPDMKATSGRINPHGIPYFYLSNNEETCIAEVQKKNSEQPKVAIVKNKRTLSILDLCLIARIELPHILDYKKYNQRQNLIFLNAFINEISKPLRKEDRLHLDYIPTQIIIEWLQTSILKAKLDGISYPSAAIPGGQNINYSFFPNACDEDIFESIWEINICSNLERQ